MKIGQSVKQVRKKKGISQKDLCKSIGITQSYLSQVENDKKTPSIDVLETISNHFDMPLSIMLWFSLKEEDIEEHKREIYRSLKPVLDEMVNSLITSK